jgi:hypothetical protein
MSNEVIVLIKSEALTFLILLSALYGVLEIAISSGTWQLPMSLNSSRLIPHLRRHCHGPPDPGPCRSFSPL